MNPHAFYRQRLIQEIVAFDPADILEVGAGDGAFLELASAHGLRAEGLEPDEDALAQCLRKGLRAHKGAAERLPFQDRAFDLVVFSYTAHHVADWAMALSEALRTCRRGVVLLDPWYDVSIASQANSSAFDRWAKRIDRHCGMIHNDCMDANVLLHPLERLAADVPTIRVQHLLELRYLEVPLVASRAAMHLARIADARVFRDESEAILAQGTEGGFTEDGAILVSISK